MKTKTKLSIFFSMIIMVGVLSGANSLRLIFDAAASASALTAQETYPIKCRLESNILHTIFLDDDYATDAYTVTGSGRTGYGGDVTEKCPAQLHLYGKSLENYKDSTITISQGALLQVGSNCSYLCSGVGKVVNIPRTGSSSDIAAIWNDGIAELEYFTIEAPYSPAVVNNGTATFGTRLNITGSSVTNSGTLNITSGTYTGTAFTNSGTLSISGGTYSGTTFADTGTMTISGGTFTGATIPDTAVITGGVFDTKPSASQIAEGKTAIQNDDGYWEIGEDCTNQSCASSPDCNEGEECSGTGDNTGGNTGDNTGGNTGDDNNNTVDCDTTDCSAAGIHDNEELQEILDDIVNTCTSTQLKDSVCSEGNGDTVNKAINAEADGHSIYASVGYTRVSSSNITSADRTRIVSAAGDRIILAYYEVTVTVYDETAGTVLGTLSDLPDDINVSLPLPDDTPAVADGYTREYSSIRLHNNATSVLPATKSGNYVKFASNQFSLYAIAYIDNANANSNNGSGNNSGGSSDNGSGDNSGNGSSSGSSDNSGNSSDNSSSSSNNNSKNSSSNNSLSSNTSASSSSSNDASSSESEATASAGSNSILAPNTGSRQSYTEQNANSLGILISATISALCTYLAYRVYRYSKVRA